LILARAPLRLSFGGGGTDLKSYYQRFGSFFVSAAIDKYVYVSVNRPASDALIRVKYSKSEEVSSPAEVQHDLVREALLELGIDVNVEIASMADVSAGTGMGSSGSYLVALLIALHALKQDHLARWALAEEACEIEIERAGHPVGKQDQYVAVWGGLNCYEIDRAGEVRVSPLKIPIFAQEDLERCLLLYNLGVTRDSSEILSQQGNDTADGKADVIDSLHRTKELGQAVKVALEAGDLVRFGALMHEHWTNKKIRSSHISTPRIDEVYDRARRAGALGGKVVGAGGGGFLMLLVGEDEVRKVRTAMVETGLQQMPFAFDLEGAKVLLNV
jgi:D-glycero-alpha-D-manno-heptose-7-phosphate kinase